MIYYFYEGENMYSKLIDLLNHKIESYDSELRKINKDINEIKDLYDILKKYDLYDSSSIIEADDEKSNRLYNVLYEHNKLSIKLLNKFGRLSLSYEKEYNKDNLLSRSLSINDNIFDMFKQTAKYEEINNLCVEIISYNNNFIINRYEALIKRKEEIKNEKKHFEYAKRNIKSNSYLIPRDIGVINNLIYDVRNEKLQSELYDLLNKYIISKLPIKNKEKEEKIKIKNDNYIFVDDLDVRDKKEDKYSRINENYLIALRCFDSYEDISLFLDSIRDKFDIKIVIEKIINLLNKDEEKLRQHLIRYLNSNQIDDTKEIIKEDKNISNEILFIGFLENKNKVLNDCIKSDIPDEYYDDIYKGLNLIKENGAEGKRQNIVRRKKIFKLRVNSIRITYKRLAKNVYIILGIFKKDDKVGKNVIETTIRRDKELVLVEKSILDSMNIKELWNEYIIQNNKMFDEIKRGLKQDNTCLKSTKVL